MIIHSRTLDLDTCFVLATFHFGNEDERYQFSTRIAKHYRDMAIQKKFPCEPCAKSYKTAQMLKKHINVVHEKLKPYPCNLCNKKYTDSTPLRIHKLAAHTEKKNLPCPECSKGFTNKAGLDAHFYRSHVINEKKNCKYCQKSFHRYTLTKHEQGHENIEKQIFKCTPCGKAFSNKVILKRHTAINHEQSDYYSNDNKCPQCGKIYKQREYLLKHIRYIHKNSEAGKWICEICKKEFSQYGPLSVHRKNHYETNVDCAVCKKTFANGLTLRDHIQRVHSKNFKKCPVCHKETTYFDYNSHVKKHSNKKAIHKCIFCDYTTDIKGNLKIHISKRHLRENSDEKFACSECDYQGNTETSLTRHIKSNHPKEDFSCHLCTETFKKLKVLRHHTKMVHLKEKTLDFECKFCEQRFTGRSTRARHIKNVHNG